MPFGLMNAAQTFQRLMDRLFRSLPFVFTYLDDHLIASRTLEEHMEYLSQFYQVLQDNGLTINPAKCTFAASSVKFLGHMVLESGITPRLKHVTAIQEFPAPNTIKQLQQFLGMVNFYRRLLPRIAATLQPLTDLLRGNPKSVDRFRRRRVHRRQGRPCRRSATLASRSRSNTCTGGRCIRFACRRRSPATRKTGHGVHWFFSRKN
jgi:hypothetical protein